MEDLGRALAFDGGAHLYIQGKFWPIGLISLEETCAVLLVPNILEVQIYERVALKIGKFPSFIGEIRNVRSDHINIQFLGPIHSSIISELGFGEDSSDNLAREKVCYSELKTALRVSLFAA